MSYRTIGLSPFFPTSLFGGGKIIHTIVCLNAHFQHTETFTSEI